MKFKTKVLIFLIAVLLSLLEFNIIASCSCFEDIIKVSKKAGYELIANVVAAEVHTYGKP
ncbi:MAG: hypothetical protein JSV96_03530 [Candidatus Aminicenantes bacterium]|nr:MAG: hypothetical protein JSV96_03530 [Candidatus Aminicenantes bacterium]